MKKSFIILILTTIICLFMDKMFGQDLLKGEQIGIVRGDNDSVKVVKIVVWVGENIGYDYSLMKKADTMNHYNYEKECSVEKVFLRRKATCVGFTNMVLYYAKIFKIKNICRGRVYFSDVTHATPIYTWKGKKYKTDANTQSNICKSGDGTGCPDMVFDRLEN